MSLKYSVAGSDQEYLDLNKCSSFEVNERQSEYDASIVNIDSLYKKPDKSEVMRNQTLSYDGNLFQNLKKNWKGGKSTQIQRQDDVHDIVKQSFDITNAKTS